MEGTDFREFKERLLKKPGIRKEYEALDYKYKIIQAIIARRNELSLSQRELARSIGMQQPAICRLERGDSNTTIGTLCRVAQALNLDIEFKTRDCVKA